MNLDAILAAVVLEFLNAPAWADAKIAPRMRYKQQGIKAIPVKPVTWPPADPFTVSAALGVDPSSDEARARYYLPMGHALAHQAKISGAIAPGQIRLSIKQGPAFGGVPAVTVTAEAVPYEPEPESPKLSISLLEEATNMVKAALAAEGQG